MVAKRWKKYFFRPRALKWESLVVLGEHITRVSPAQLDTEIYTTVPTKHKLLITSYIHIITSSLQDL